MDERRRLELGRRRHRCKAIEIDPGVDHLRLAARLRQPFLELVPQVLRDGDHGRRTLDDPARQVRDAGHRADVAHVASVRRHDERRVHLRREETGGDEEVRPDDVRLRRGAHAPARARRTATSRRRAGRGRPARSRARGRGAHVRAVRRTIRGPGRPVRDTSARPGGSSCARDATRRGRRAATRPVPDDARWLGRSSATRCPRPGSAR